MEYASSNSSSTSGNALLFDLRSSPLTLRPEAYSSQFNGWGTYKALLGRRADLVVDNHLDLVKVVAALVVGQRTYRDAHRPIYDISIAEVHQADHVDWPGSSSDIETSIYKPSEYLFHRRLYSYGEFTADRSRPVSLSFLRRLLTRGSIQ
ncbi:hypothetical protein ACH5RR_015550 [Cinchona calisaya]|uniref:Uncharacterized protein n=1 Tax=Cinchona calisaya TaxID=153742 RepID=A0ABD2ZVC9_9GENT